MRAPFHTQRVLMPETEKRWAVKIALMALLPLVALLALLTAEVRRWSKVAAPREVLLSVTPPHQAGFYELSDDRRAQFLKRLSVQAAPRDTVKIGCTSNTSCVAAERFLLLFREVGWPITDKKVFRFEPQVPITGVAIMTYTAADEPQDPVGESHKTIYDAFHEVDIPVSVSRDTSLKEGTLGIYFGSER